MNVPKIRFNDFDDNISKISIKELGNVITGTTPSTADRSNYGDEYLWASPVDMGDFKYINNTKTKLSEKGFNKTRCVPKDSILITCIGSTIGKTGMASKEMSTNQQINTLIPNKNYNSDYLYYCINFNFPRFLNKISFQAVPIISKSEFEKLEVSITKNIYEQEKIGNMLSLIDKKIELQSKKIEDLKLFKKGLTKELFRDINNNYFKIKDLDITISDGNYGELYPKQEELKDYGDVPFLRVNNLRRLKITNENMKYISKDKHSILLSGHLKENDILITTRGEIGLLAIVDKEHEDSNINAQIALLRINDYSKILPNYLLQYLDYNSNYIQSLQTGSALKQLPIKNLLSMNVYIPDIKMQEKISNTLTSLDNKIEKEYKKMDILYNLKKGLMQNMFV